MAEARESRTKYGTYQISKQSLQLFKKLMIMTVNECDKVNMWLGNQQRVQKEGKGACLSLPWDSKTEKRSYIRTT